MVSVIGKRRTKKKKNPYLLWTTNRESWSPDQFQQLWIRRFSLVSPNHWGKWCYESSCCYAKALYFPITWSDEDAMAEGKSSYWQLVFSGNSNGQRPSRIHIPILDQLVQNEVVKNHSLINKNSNTINFKHMCCLHVNRNGDVTILWKPMRSM